MTLKNTIEYKLLHPEKTVFSLMSFVKNLVPFVVLYFFCHQEH
jgi:hypothetical protein